MKKFSITVKERGIARILALLPSDELVSHLDTVDRMKEWIAQRCFHSWTSQCWLSLHEGKAYPLEPLLISGAMGKDLHTQIWLTTYFFESFWELVQRGFSYIRPVLTQLGVNESFNLPYKLFVLALYEISEERFSVCLKPYHEVSAGKYQKHHKLFCKATDGSLKPEEQKLLQYLNAQELKLKVVGIILGVCQKEATSREKLLKAKLDDCFTAIDRLAVHEPTLARKQGSFAWNKGERIKSFRYGGTYSNA